MRRTSRLGVQGVTLIELLVSIGIGALLIGLTVPISSMFVKKAKKVRCISNMRTLHSALSGFVSDTGHWPQMEKDRFDFTEEDFFRFWVVATEPYGMSQDTWLCPMDRNIELKAEAIKQSHYGSYAVTRFDEIPATPFRWNQPWAMERGNFHGKGVHILMPDGSVSDSQNPFSGR